jgi:hypothetical protein
MSAPAFRLRTRSFANDCCNPATFVEVGAPSRRRPSALPGAEQIKNLGLVPAQVLKDGLWRFDGCLNRTS